MIRWGSRRPHHFTAATHTLLYLAIHSDATSPSLPHSAPTLNFRLYFLRRRHFASRLISFPAPQFPSIASDISAVVFLYIVNDKLHMVIIKCLKLLLMETAVLPFL
jgi:hypothetical protein